jgi:hypothetical protein
LELKRREVLRWLAGQFAHDLLLIHAVLERLASINENDWDFIVVKASYLGVGVHINFAPLETALPMELDEALLYDLAEMAPLTRIKNDFSGLRHDAECSSFGAAFPTCLPE